MCVACDDPKASKGIVGEAYDEFVMCDVVHDNCGVVESDSSYGVCNTLDDIDVSDGTTNLHVELKNMLKTLAFVGIEVDWSFSFCSHEAVLELFHESSIFPGRNDDVQISRSPRVRLKNTTQDKRPRNDCAIFLGHVRLDK